jgi:AcrR family transcriptional regulator
MKWLRLVVNMDNRRKAAWPPGERLEWRPARDGMARKKPEISDERAAARGAGARAPRKRRSPDEARTHLLDAAEHLLSEHGPDAVGLRDVAQEAGVSHGLITHYFKTYEGLVEAVFTRRTQRIAERVLSSFAQMQAVPSADALVELMLSIASEPLHLRLVAWAMLSGRALQADFLPGRERGLRPIADAIHKAASAEAKQRGTPAPSRDDADYALLLMLGAAYGWGIGHVPFLASLGRKGTPRTDREVKKRLMTMVRALLAPGVPASRTSSDP